MHNMKKLKFQLVTDTDVINEGCFGGAALGAFGMLQCFGMSNTLF